MIMDNAKGREFIYGINPVYLAVVENAGNRKIYRLYLNRDRKKTDQISWLKHKCLKENIEIMELDKRGFRNFASKNLGCDYEHTQGIVLEASAYNYHHLEGYISKGITPRSYLVMLDGITDVGNFGSVVRNCRAFGADGLIISKNRSVQVTGRADKVSAGALEGVKVIRVTNLVRAIRKLKESGFWIYGTETKKGRAEDICRVEWAFPLVIIMGSEQKGLSRLVGENCDFFINIGMSSGTDSLNVSVASGITMHKIYEEILK